MALAELRSSAAIALLILVCASAVSGEVQAQRRGDSFVDCVLDRGGPAGEAVAGCFAVYMADLHDFARRARPRPLTTCRRGCDTLGREIGVSCADLHRRGIRCEILSPTLERACRYDCDGKTCTARCLAASVRKMMDCSQERTPRARRRCEAHARRTLRRCRRACEPQAR